MPVNKSELIDQVAEKAGLSKADAGRALDAVLDSVTAQLRATAYKERAQRAWRYGQAEKLAGHPREDWLGAHQQQWNRRPQAASLQRARERHAVHPRHAEVDHEQGRPDLRE